MITLGRSLIIFGVILIALGLIFTFGGRLSWFGRLPGDIYIQKKNFTLFFPITTSIILSIAASVIIMLINRR